MPTEVVAPVVATPAVAPVAATPVVPAAAAPVAAPVGAPATPATPATPAAVEYKFDAVDGVAPEFDSNVVATAKALGWDLETAKKFRAHEIELARSEMANDAKAGEAARAAEVQRVAQEDAAWEKANREHPEFGGAKYDETSTKIDKLFAEYDKSGELSKHLAQVPRLKAEPAFRSFLAAIAHSHGEGRFIQGGNANQPSSSQAASLAEMYPSMVKR